MNRLLVVKSNLLIWSVKYQQDLLEIIPGWEILVDPEAETMDKRISEAEVILGRVSPELLKRADALRWIQLHGAGADRDSRTLRDREVLITNASGVHAVPITEHILAFMLAFARGTDYAIGVLSLGRSWSSPVGTPCADFVPRTWARIGAGQSKSGML